MHAKERARRPCRSPAWIWSGCSDSVGWFLVFDSVGKISKDWQRWWWSNKELREKMCCSVVLVDRFP